MVIETSGSICVITTSGDITATETFGITCVAITSGTRMEIAAYDATRVTSASGISFTSQTQTGSFTSVMIIGGSELGGTTPRRGHGGRSHLRIA